ncbi:MAG TPA: serine/threonine-protein kinase [Pirellulales bacterium]|jgi:serine/threonine protein kinase/Tfp pilus assembly protein PilF|nr:serine/threonine-protein kinase [Pirellulales bacterium]
MVSESSTDRNVAQQPLAPALTLDGWVDRFAAEWERDRRLTARRFVELHPESAADKQLVAMLAFEEFRLRTQAGDEPNSQTFLDQFPDCRENLQPLLAVYRFMGGESALAAALRSSQVAEAARPDATPSQAEGPFEASGEWPEPGQILGGFKLLEMLGRGAYSRVYLAEESAVGCRRVVVKASLSGGNEAHTLGKLGHPNIVPIYSVQTEPDFGLTLICMPFVGRATLHDVLVSLYAAGRPRPTRGRGLLDALASRTGERAPDGQVDPLLVRASYVDAVVHLGAQLADALAYTNGKSVLHRDIKPSNVLLDASGKPMLLDFNLSYDFERRTRRVGGTLGYAAPEILAALLPRTSGRTATADARSDLYSLGVILYELLGGQLPYGKPPAPGAVGNGSFEGGPFERWLNEQRGRPRRLSDRNPDVGRELADLIERCLSFDVEQRPASAAQVATTLKRLLTRRSRLTRWANRHRGAVTSLVVLASLLVAAGAYAAATRPSYADRQYARAVTAGELGEDESVLAYLAEAEAHGLDRQRLFGLRGRAHYRLAKRAFAAEDFAAARDQCTQAIESRLTTWQAYVLRARARFHLREFDLALDDIDAAVGRRVVPQLISVRGDCMCGKYKWDSAIRAYNKAIDDGFSSAGLLNNIAFAYINSGQREESLDYLDRAIAADESLADAYYQRAGVSAALAVDGQRDVPLSAIQDIETAIRLRPKNYRAHLKAAQIYTWHEKVGGVQDRERAIEVVLESLRLGLDPAELPREGPLTELMKVVRGLPKYAKAVADGSRVQRSDPPGLVDSLAGLDFDDDDELAGQR